MKNDSKLSMACWGWVSMGLAWGYLWFLSSPGPRVTWEVEIRERIQLMWTKCHTRECLQALHSSYILFSFLLDVKKQNHVSLVLIQGSQSSRFYSVTNGEPQKASPIKCCPWLGRKKPLWWGVCFLSRCFPLLHGSSADQIQFTECPNISRTVVFLPISFSLAMPSLPHLLGLCLLPSHLVLSPFLHLLAWGRCPCHCHKLISVKASAIPCYSCEGNCLYYSWTLSLGWKKCAHSNLQCPVTSTASSIQ